MSSTDPRARKAYLRLGYGAPAAELLGGPVRPGRSRGTAPARPSAFLLETPCLRFARDASVSGSAQLTTAQDDREVPTLTT